MYEILMNLTLFADANVQTTGTNNTGNTVAPDKVLEALDKDSKALAQRAMEKGTTEEAEAEMETMRRQLEEANQREERQKQQARQEQERNALRQQAQAWRKSFASMTSAEYEAAKAAMLQGGKAPWEK